MSKRGTLMSIPPFVVTTARKGWKWQWNQLMNALAPADKQGNYCRPASQYLNAVIPNEDELKTRSERQLPKLIVGRSCPWAHRTWLVYQLRGLEANLSLFLAKADHEGGRWQLDPPLMGCNSLLALYKLCGTPPSNRATVPTLLDPGLTPYSKPQLISNESAQLVELLNQWPTTNNAPDLSPKRLQSEIQNWQELLQNAVNDGVYRCGFARTQTAYDKACTELFNALQEVEKNLSKSGPWLCGNQLTLADIRLFPTLIRWEMVYVPLFGCTKQPLWSFPNLWRWRQRFLALPKVSQTCNSFTWRKDYFQALFPLRPNNIVPAGPDLAKIVNAAPPEIK